MLGRNGIILIHLYLLNLIQAILRDGFFNFQIILIPISVSAKQDADHLYFGMCKGDKFNEFQSGSDCTSYTSMLRYALRNLSKIWCIWHKRNACASGGRGGNNRHERDARASRSRSTIQTGISETAIPVKIVIQ